MVGVVLNPNAGRGQGARIASDLRGLLDAVLPSGWIMAETEKHGDGRIQASRLMDRGATLIASAGGDGTLSECLGAVLERDVPLAVIPIGTGNDFGRQIGVRTMTDAVRLLAEPNLARVDLALANGRPFLDTLACGFDSAVGERVNQGSRLLKGTAAYVGAIGATLLSYRPVDAKVVIDGEAWQGRIMLAAVCNCRSYGGGFQVAPRASIVDGLLDLVVVEEMPRLRFLTQLSKVMKGAHLDLPEVHCWQGRRIALETDPPMRWMCDGELQTNTPVEALVKPASLSMVLPRSGDMLQPL